MFQTRAGLVLVLLVLQFACGGQPAGDQGAAVPADAGPSAAPDSGPPFDASRVADGAAAVDAASTGDVAQATTPGLCAGWGKPLAQGALAQPELAEISGLAESVRHPGVLWAHADSGDSARLFALSPEGTLRAIVQLQGAVARDWEDIALGPCESAQDPASWGCLYVADLGDNLLASDHGFIFRVDEPASLPAPATRSGAPVLQRSSTQWRSWTLNWPHGPRDVEALAAMPDGRLVLMTKESTKGLSEVYRVALDSAGHALATRLGELPTALADVKEGLGVMVTAADLTVDGRHLLVRTYLRLFHFDLGDTLVAAPGQAAMALASAPRLEVPVAVEIQGEAVAWSRSGGYWHASETFKTVVAKLYRVRCQAAQ